MTDNAQSDVRFAIIRFADNDEASRLRLLLREYGFEEPTWLDSDGQQISPPPSPHAAGGDQPDPDPEPAQSLPLSQTTHRPSVGEGRIISLRLPTILADRPSTSTLQGHSSSAILPLASTTEPSTPSSSSHVSVFAHAPTSPEESAHQGQSSSDPPSTSGFQTSDNPPTDVGESSASASTVARPWVNPAPLRPRGKKPQVHEGPNVYYTCTICNNKILGTRVSNLQNHVRRHSTLKQFQCCYCDYAHNEIAKVRLHMTNNHKDTESAPVNNLTPQMQAIWRALFRECFPTRAQRRRGARAIQPASSSPQAGPSGLAQQRQSSASHGQTASKNPQRLFRMGRRRVSKNIRNNEKVQLKNLSKQKILENHNEKETGKSDCDDDSTPGKFVKMPFFGSPIASAMRTLKDANRFHFWKHHLARRHRGRAAAA